MAAEDACPVCGVLEANRTRLTMDAASLKPLISAQAAYMAWGKAETLAAVQAGKLKPVPGLNAFWILKVT